MQIPVSHENRKRSSPPGIEHPDAMGSPHYFLIHNLGAFLLDLTARGYAKNVTPNNTGEWVVYSKNISSALIKHYSYSSRESSDSAIPMRVTYELVKHGIPLKRLAKKLKLLNVRYRKALPGWKTKRTPKKGTRQRRWADIQRFLRQHAVLISVFKYKSDDVLTEGNPSFNVQMASTPKEQAICFDFIKALVEAYSPEAIRRGSRQIDRPALQRNGWIKRFAGVHRKRGWSAREIVREAQKELREGTWNQRSKVQYNLAPNTISKIAGLKLSSFASN
jgi:hypothetical protein